MNHQIFYNIANINTIVQINYFYLYLYYNLIFYIFQVFLFYLFLYVLNLIIILKINVHLIDENL